MCKLTDIIKERQCKYIFRIKESESNILNTMITTNQKLTQKYRGLTNEKYIRWLAVGEQYGT